MGGSDTLLLSFAVLLAIIGFFAFTWFLGWAILETASMFTDVRERGFISEFAVGFVVEAAIGALSQIAGCWRSR